MGESGTKNDDPIKRSKITCFEDLLEITGTSGFRNFLIIFAAASTTIINPLDTFSYQFFGETPDHWCHVPELSNNNWTIDQIKDVAIPTVERNGNVTYSNCEMFDFDFETLRGKSYEDAKNETSKVHLVKSCSRRDFEDYYETIVNKWDLVCERRALYSTTNSAIQVGKFLGSLVGGYSIDRFGRAFLYRVSVLMYIINGFATLLAPNIGVFIAFRVISATTASVYYMASFVLVMEFCSVKQRSVVGNYFPLPWALGIMLTPGIAYLFRPWYYLQVAITVPALILLFNSWFLPESPRWLILKGEHERAIKILSVIAVSNKRVLPPEEELRTSMQHLQQQALIETLNEGESDQKLKTLARKFLRFFQQLLFMVTDPKLRRLTLPCIFCWFASSTIYYGVSLGATVISTNVYLYIFLGGVIEIPSYLILWPAVVKFGRRNSLIGFHLICSSSILAVMALSLADSSNDYSVLKLILFLTGKFAITAAFHLLWVFTAELFPTTFRSFIVGECSSFARIGSFSSPYINDLLGAVNSWAPSALFGGISVVAGMMTFALPDTTDKNLPDSLEETEAVEKPPKPADNKF